MCTINSLLTVFIFIESINGDIAYFKVGEVLAKVVKRHPELSIILIVLVQLATLLLRHVLPNGAPTISGKL